MLFVKFLISMFSALFGAIVVLVPILCILFVAVIVWSILYKMLLMLSNWINEPEQHQSSGKERTLITTHYDPEGYYFGKVARDYMTKHDGVVEEYCRYLFDGVEMFRFPALNDVSVETTRDFINSLCLANELKPQQDKKYLGESINDYIDSVSDLQKDWLEAEMFARNHKLDYNGDNELFAKALKLAEGADGGGRSDEERELFLEVARANLSKAYQDSGSEVLDPEFRSLLEGLHKVFSKRKQLETHN